jgi:hypothetical protein
VTSETPTATLMKIQPSLRGLYGLSTGKQIPAFQRNELSDFKSRYGRLSPVSGSFCFIIPIFNSLNTPNSTQFRVPVNFMFAHIHNRHNDTVAYSINYFSFFGRGHPDVF